MAIIWRKQVSGTRYEVRLAGNTKRLYTNGVCHTQFNPRRPFQGNVWDLLALPALFAPKTIKRVLLLGVGGGAVIKQLQALVKPRLIVGVELDAVHLGIAKRFFRADGRTVRLHHDDAAQWLASYRGAPFDMVIEDVFGERKGQPIRAIDADETWFRTLQKHLTPRGILVMNFDTPWRLRRCAYFTSPAIARSFPSAYRLSTPQNHNVVCAFLRERIELQTLEQAIANKPAQPSLHHARSAYRIRRVGESKQSKR